MTNEETIFYMTLYKRRLEASVSSDMDEDIKAFDTAIKALEQHPCEDAISRKDMLAVLRQSHSLTQAWDGFEKLPSVTPKEEIIHCKDCKYRDYWGECNKWSKELDAHKTYLLDENMFCGFAERK